MGFDFLQFAKPLIRTPTAPFHEHFALGIARSFAAERPLIQVLHDRCGNSLLLYDGGGQREEDEFIVLTAHLDPPRLSVADPRRGQAEHCSKSSAASSWSRP